jgi:splicing factor 3B subunit 4
MNGQYLMNKPVSVQYAFKKEGKGERHGTAAERLLAAQAKKHALLPAGPGTGANGYMPVQPPAPPPGFAQAYQGESGSLSTGHD